VTGRQTLQRASVRPKPRLDSLGIDLAEELRDQRQEVRLEAPVVADADAAGFLVALDERAQPEGARLVHRLQRGEVA